MGFSVSASFAVILIASIVAFGTLYLSLENSYLSLANSVEVYKESFIKRQTSRLSLYSHSYDDPDQNASMYSITFNITNNGSTLSPKYWNFIRDGRLKNPDGSTLIVENKSYLLPGEHISVTATEIKDNDVHSLVIATETGCSLKIEWRWVWLDQNQTIGGPSIVGTSWYCN
ncbi:hypothetical protein [Thermococcus sp. 2319x1]|uniref:hypothetical protein n=1 Tax=Thermococcus sp. 2319x1 TaxID=1674923 RepID=UPI00158180CC|nr:hypothetical protein [Thermococcus sp. 2319x1]